MRAALQAPDRDWPPGRTTLEVAGFPAKVARVLDELAGEAGERDLDRFRTAPRGPEPDIAALRPAAAAAGLDVKGLLLRADRERPTPGWRLLTDAFRVDGHPDNAALLLSPDLEVVERWVLGEVPVGEQRPQPKRHRFLEELRCKG